jgi:hypothetical protein
MSFGKINQNDSTLKQFTLGGLSGCAASMCTHPFDTVKVRMQLSGINQKIYNEGIFKTAYKICINEGILTLYNGLSASLLRQATYTTTRFGIYLKLKDIFSPKDGKPMPLTQKILLSMLAGAGGAMVGSPADVVLVRMQADGKLPLQQRRNYKNAIDGLIKIIKDEGILKLWRGSGPNTNRAMLMAVGQLASYDQCKQLLLKLSYFEDDTKTHLTASFMAAFIATVITNPLDVIKTRIMNQQKQSSHEGIIYKNSFDCAIKVLKTEGLLGFYKGFIPYFARLGPQTILTFIFFEKFSVLWDYLKKK